MLFNCDFKFLSFYRVFIKKRDYILLINVQTLTEIESWCSILNFPFAEMVKSEVKSPFSTGTVFTISCKVGETIKKLFSKVCHHPKIIMIILAIIKYNKELLQYFFIFFMQICFWTYSRRSMVVFHPHFDIILHCQFSSVSHGWAHGDPDQFSRGFGRSIRCPIWNSAGWIHLGLF